MGKKSGSGSGIRIRDEHPGSFQEHFQEFRRNNFLFFDADPGFEMEKIRILDKHPGSATLEPTLSPVVKGPDSPHNFKIFNMSCRRSFLFL
jgi:hypothetical protein